MASINWDSRLETGHVDLDAEHRTLIATFNRLCAVLDRGEANREELEGLLIFLRNFAMTHFETEQRLMVRYHYPEEAKHRQLHADLASEMDTTLDAYHKGTTQLSPDTMEYLDEWLQKHIREEDFRLAEFLQQAQAQQKGQE